MRTVFVLAVLVFAACASAGAVLELNGDNFDAYVGGPKAVLVKFFAPWCGHCKHLAPEFEKAAEAFANSPKVVLAEVDCDQHKDLCNKHGIRGFPTMKSVDLPLTFSFFFPFSLNQHTRAHNTRFFKARSTKPQEYEGQRTSQSIIEFVQNQGAGKPAGVRSAVVDLTPETFDSVVLDASKGVMVKFFAPWCGHCKKLAPEYEKAAAAFARDASKVVIAEVDCDQHKDLCHRFDVSGFPTVKWFGAGAEDKGKGEEYRGGRTLKEIVRYVNNAAGLKRLEDGRLDETAGRIKELDEIAGKFLAAGDRAAGMLKRAKEIAEKEDAPASAKFYIKAMESVIAKGSEFVAKEKARITGILEGAAVAESKIDDFTIRRNILEAF